MRINFALIACLVLLAFALGCVQQEYPNTYVYNNVTIKWLGHASVEILASNNTVYFDPFVLGKNPDRADYILITHSHPDHCSAAAVGELQRNWTRIISTMDCIANMTGKTNSIIPGDFFNYTAYDVYVEAFEAYNTLSSYHPKGEGVGLMLITNGTKIYHAGDTDNIPEFANLTKENIDVLFLPIGGKYTMNVTEAAKAARVIKPKIVIPIHYNSDKYGLTDIHADPEQFKKLLEGSDIKVVILSPAA
jgi:L-ascorbate metabolism protein UlaG (beta-lactamase superfamily)